MLPSALRLRRRSDFGKVYSKGRSYSTDLIVMYVLPQRDSDIRVGFSVSKKLGKSVKRNRTRRLLQESARLLLPRLERGYDVIILARARAAGKSFEDLARDVEFLADRFGLLREDAGRQLTS